MIKRFFKRAAAFLLVGLIVGCGQQPPSAVKDTAFKWEKAYFDNDYKEQQQLLYKKGTYEVDKTSKKRNSGLKSKNIRYEIYYDKELSWYYVLTSFINPKGENKVEHELVIRKKAGAWKVDMKAAKDISREGIEDKFTRKACINCK